MKMRWTVLPVVLWLCSLSVVTVSAGEIHVSAAASLKNALAEIIDGFKKTAPDSLIRTNFGASGAQAKQIVQGAPADIFISAHPKWLDFIIKEGKGLEATKHILAYNKLVFAGKKGIVVNSLADLQGLQRVAIGSPASVPAGQYAEQALRATGVYEALAKEKKLVMAQDVRQALLYADRGEVDGAFVYKTDALLVEHAQILLVVPDNLYDRIVYPSVLTTTGAAKEEVKVFYTYLAGPEAQAILQQYGFETTK